jgi:glycosyltransferase involved in cell wall biosynthesis
MKTSAKAPLRVLVVAAHLEDCRDEIAAGQCPSNHLWGMEYLASIGDDVVYVPARGTTWLHRFARAVTRWTRGRFGDLELELELFRHRSQGDVIYIVTGTVFWHVVLRALGWLRTPIVECRHVPPRRPTWSLRDLKDARILRRGYDGFACLTRKTELAFAAEFPRSVSRSLEWYADLRMFAPQAKRGEFFFACGRTNRDYATLVRAAAEVNFPIKLLVSPALLAGLEIPPNVSFIEGPEDPNTDDGLAYGSVIDDLYAPALAVLIPRKHDPNDTCGLTNILETMAMGKPIVMTRTGCLDIDVEGDGIGLHTEPGDAASWVRAMRRLVDERGLAERLGARARTVAEERYSLEKFGVALRALLGKVVMQARA